MIKKKKYILVVIFQVTALLGVCPYRTQLCDPLTSQHAD